MLRVPGSRSAATSSHPSGLSEDLYTVRANGGDVRVVYSPLDALTIAETHPDREVVFFGVGFETTAPANAMAVRAARDRGIANFSVLVSHVLVPPAIEAILDAPQRRVDAFLAAGHVCTVMGMKQYQELVDRHQVPIVVTGFEPLDVLDGIRRAVIQLEAGRAEVDNAYARAVRPDGNRMAQQLLHEVFEDVDRSWRGIGTIAKSGWRLRDEFGAFDAERRFDVGHIIARESLVCRAGEVLQGLIRPTECSAFGTSCTPRNPLGAPMVSAEGACAAYHHRGSVSVGAAP
jgi:hydrogenase expression/formation protein HypD